jgi:tyrosine-protein kinase Etk/Wzc
MDNSNSNNSGYYQPFFPDDDSIDLKRYISLFISNWYLFAIFLFLTFTLAYGINRYSEEEFSVSSSLLIKDEMQGGFTGMDPIFPGTEAFKNQQNLKNEIGILKSFSLNSDVIDSLPEFHTEYVHIGRRSIAETKQYKTTPFNVKYTSTTKKNFYTKYFVKILSAGSFEISILGNETFGGINYFGDTIIDRDSKFTLELRNIGSFVYDESASNKYYFYFPDPEILANEYRNKLQVSPIDDDATLVTLTVAGKVAEQEIDYLNTLMGLYINRGLVDKNRTAELTIQFINQQLNSIHDSLSVAEDSLQQFRLKNKLIDISNEGSSLKGKLEKFETEKTNLGLQKKYFNYLQEYLISKEQTGDIVSPSVIGINDPILEKIVNELAGLQQQKSQLALNLSLDLPVLSLMDRKINVSKQSLKENIENSLENLNLSINDVDQRINAVEAELRKLPDTERGLIRIQRKFDLNNTVYTYLLEKRAEAGIAKASNVPDNKKVDEAGIYSVVPIKPRPGRNNMMAFILGLIIPAIAIFIIDYLNNKVIDKKDIEKATSAPVLGFISHNDYKTETPVISKPSSTLAESFRSVRTALKFFIKESETPVISISSTVSSEGKTFISVNLAVITAMLGKKVLLVGLDLRKPKIHRLLEVQNDVGMSNYLSENLKFDEAIQTTAVTNLFYAPSGPVPPNPAELIESARMKEFLDEARAKFDYIIIDTPPVAIVTDALLLAPHVDVNIFVVRQRYTSKNTLSLIQEFYQNKRLKNIAIVINDISLSGYYGYGLRYGYTMRYGGYSYGYNFYGDYVYGKYGYKKESEGYYKEEKET